MASLDRMEGDGIELLLVVGLILAVWLYVKSKGVSGAANALWTAIDKALRSLGNAIDSVIYGTMQRIESANLTGSNSGGGSTYGTGASYDVQTGTNTGADYAPLAGVNNGSN